MSGYCFYSPDAQGLAEKYNIKSIIDEYAENNKKQTYVLCKPLAKNDAVYDYTEAVVIFSSGAHPCIIDLGKNHDGAQDYSDDLIDDISFLSEKFKYREKIGRKKSWQMLFKICDHEELNISNFILDKSSDIRTVELLTSLVVGSINDISRINLEAQQVLDLVKSKIILFDTDQTTFVFKPTAGKRYAVQGLAGSGKTELLLHKLKELYSHNLDARIAFTCFNKILASSMRSRIPEFFDFMRVERQIDWNSKLFCFHAWGSAKAPESGMYRYICHSYGIPFGSLQSGSFDILCKKAIKDITEKTNKGEEAHLFDFIFIDESQDFSDSFIDLCDLVTSKKIFIAGDVFQNIFRPIDSRVGTAELVLKKCYRTDPKNLMFSHALGMGLFEDPVLRWLQPSEWDSCGYTYKENGLRANISRDTLRRFEDIPAEFISTIIKTLRSDDKICDTLIDTVRDIRLRHETVNQGDIAIIFLDKDSYIYDIIPRLEERLNSEFNWEANISFETKTNDPDKLFISNINNAKGLEFPFVICFSNKLSKTPSFRNALYTMMARSFLESHLILGSRVDPNVASKASEGLKFIQTNGYMDVRIPSQEEIANQEKIFIFEEAESLEKVIRSFCKEKNASPRLTAKLVSRITNFIGDEDYDSEYINDFLEIEYNKNMKV